MALGFANRIREGGPGKAPLCRTKVLRRYDDQWNRIHTAPKPPGHHFVPWTGNFFWARTGEGLPEEDGALDGLPGWLGEEIWPGFSGAGLATHVMSPSDLGRP